MIHVTQVTEMGGACPWQLEGRTDDGRDVYARYRGGRVAVYVGVMWPETKHGVFEQRFGEPLNGWLNGATLAALTKGLIEWPDSVVKDGEVITP